VSDDRPIDRFEMTDSVTLRRWTPLTFLAPSRYVDHDPWWDSFDLVAWSREQYTWTADGWNGYRDFAQRPRETVARGRGDCEDYALVVLAWAVATGRAGLGLAFCFEPPTPWPTHVVAYDDGFVYSSGAVMRTTLARYIDRSRYRFALRRRVR
jgi:hypothetical protein